MNAIINYVGSIIGSIVSILNTRFFSDIPLSFLDFILGGLLIKVILRLVFGGFKEMDTNLGFSRISFSNRKASKSMSNKDREVQVISETLEDDIIRVIEKGK